MLVFNCILALSFEELLLSGTLTLHKDMTAVSCIKCRKMLIPRIESLDSDTVVFVVPLLRPPRRDITLSFYIAFSLLDSACSYGIHGAEALGILISLIPLPWLFFNDQIWQSRWFLVVLTFLLEFTFIMNAR